MKAMKSTLAAIVAASLLAAPAFAGDRGGGTNWGAVVGAGILGGIIGGATAPAPQPQIIFVVPPAPIYVAPETTYRSPPQEQRIWWCSISHRWYPDVFACAVPWTH